MGQGMVFLSSLKKKKLNIIFSTTQARRWIAAGYKSLEDLLQKAKLTENQRIGVEHYNVSCVVSPRATPY